MTTPMRTPCDAWAEKLATHGEHLSLSDLAALEAHLSLCPACSLAFADYQMMHRLIHALPAPDFPVGLPPRLLQIWEQEDSDGLNEEEQVRSNELHLVSTQVNNVPSTSEEEPLADQILHCRVCGRNFLFTASDQAFFLEKGVTEPPKRCPSCLRARMNNGNVSLIDDPHHPRQKHQ